MGTYPRAGSPKGERHGVHRIVAERVAQCPEACAVRDPAGASLTYRELWLRAGWMASALAARGVRPGDPVAVDLDRGVDLVVALLGIARAGAAYLPLDAHAPAERVTGILQGAGVRVAVVAEGDGRRQRRLENTPAVTRLAVPGGDPGHEPAPDVAVDEEAPLYIGYTSGSTGVPKGVVVPHRGVRRLVTGATYCTIEPGDRVGHIANPAFDATTFEVWGALTAGATLVVLPSVADLALERWTALVRDEGITTLLLTTSLFHLVARARPDALGTLRTLLVGGEQLEISAVRRVLAAAPPERLVNAYGPTEATVIAASFDCTEESLAGRERMPVGRAIQETRIHVLDEDLRPVEPGATGELCIAGPGVAIGYLGLPERTARSFVPEPGTGEPMYRTGDLARLLPDGELEIVGRADRQVKLRGFRIELEEIERAAVATGHTEAAFVAKTGEGPDARLVAACLASSAPPKETARRLGSDLASALPAYMLPSRWTVLDTLPLTSTGKADRRRIEELLDFGPESAGAGRAEAGPDLGDPLLNVLAGVWAELLGTRAIGPGDDFISLGGNSILATQAASRIGELLSVDIEPADLLLAPDLGELARQLGRSEVVLP
ncbi:non-ribosomal peptide synthetase [Streptomyces violascens]|uniref:non-ribosomal peptide synthetase n=1 Tax=Streptomyces violascens TaxID=67381 RepID=UPI00364ED9E3